MPQIKVIFNPQADRGDNRQKADWLRHLLDEQARSADGQGILYEIDWVETEQPGHATALAHQAALEGCDAVVAVGGDGTVHEVVNGLMRVDAEQRPALGILPTGTGNDLSANFGLPLDPAEAAGAMFQPNTRPLDVGLVSDTNGRHEYWVNTLGFGFSGAVTVVARRSRTFLRGFALYLYIVLKTILLHAQNIDIRVAVDGADASPRTISMANVCNGRAEGGGFPVAPHAVMDDGLISYTFMGRLNRLQLLRFLPVVLSAKHVDYPEHFEFGTARHLRVEAAQPLVIHIDGELFSEPHHDLRQMEAEMIPAALKVLTTP